ncbi:MAG: diguanylate cyclase [Candidatus Omnitrophota bacterium]|nr:diguanylate cyclase [Candidatus Omnitrophota bacterium]
MAKDVNVLIIEDDAALAAQLDNTLKGFGYHTWIVADPKEGINLLQSNAFSVVITEMRSAKMNGARVTQAVHKISEQTNVIVITLYSSISSAIEAMEAGAYGYITKPLNSSEIRIVTERAVERYFLLSGSKDKEFLVDLAVRDGLTGLFNRRYFNELIMVEVNRLKRSPATLSVLMLDIDNFKNYNDTQGHPAGDVLLKDAAKVFKNSVRPSDIVCRYGGEEFIIILPQTEKKAATIVAERLRVQVGLYLPTTVSIGIASVPEDAQEISALIEKADSALYQAKAAGKNKWCAA